MNERAPSETVDLERRVAPQQKRSQHRIRVIVDATKRLLERGEGDTISTSRVAEQAGVPVSSVYRYFPNIYSIHRTILEEFGVETDQIVNGILEDPDWQDWRESLSGMVTGLRALIEDNPSYGAVFRLSMTTHELRSIRNEWSRRLAEVLASRWRAGLDGFHDGDPDLVARMTVEIYCAAEVLVFEQRMDQGRADAVFSEMVKALERYLAPHLG